MNIKVLGGGCCKCETLLEAVKEAVAEKPKRSARVHKVKSGDTLSKIASMHGTTIAKLCKQNRIARNSKLRLGQIIRY